MVRYREGGREIRWGREVVRYREGRERDKVG